MIYVILGQTASGKTSLALELAKKLRLPIISADAFQCYKEMNIGTDKPSREKVSGIDYLFYDEYHVDEDVSVALFQKKYRPILEAYVKANQDVLIVGGTFLYIKALLFNYQFKENDTSTSKYRSMTLSQLQSELKEKNPHLYEEIDNQNPRRLVRALEQMDEGIDRDQVLEANDNTPLYPTVFFQIDIDKEEGNILIDKRVDKMFEEGLVSEVKDLLAKYPKDLKAFQAVGYKEIISGLENGSSEDEMKELIKVHTHQYAKKQRTFLRNQFKDVLTCSKDKIKEIIEYNHLLKERTSVLLKPGMLSEIESSKVLLVGVGGVGASVLNNLVRLGFIDITIIDDDIVSPSNINRQILYTYKDINKDKVQAAEEIAHELNPLAVVKAIKRRITAIEDVPDEKFDYIIDCIDDVKGKVVLYKKAVSDESFFISSQGLGFQYDSTKVRYGKLKEANDPLARSFKEALKKDGISQSDIDNINIVHSISARLKGQRNNKTIGSLSTVPQAGGNAIVSYILKRLYEEVSHENKKD